ncbi:hypothetical protein [Commensalibacter papalotli (ex Botero et al. 2024)]|uniref:ABC transmembrane type-1 domain-containing protein n=1 Tax=Commensalibacter papalotli (ex Botero et al. 2024) TaxID=2972766 RepID=A0ABM9HS80_9PROT|nr:hypothetical protein [Commensalibacter papalotli (ex Botero et al. 2024)]CAI3940765.1 unnamed protein product [Commensalibacter papalotli (ex Botero et al. 2024)]CAI3950256.1 unnamed protein product [Commensalibacter papalotli (ex Botero et al. 2024)]
MYRFNEIWDILIKTEPFTNLKKQPYYLKWLLGVAVLLSLIALAIAVLQYLFWQSQTNNKIYTVIVLGMSYVLFIYVVVVILFDSFKEFKQLRKQKVNFIFLSSYYIQYYEDRAFELCEKYKLYELQYALNRIQIIFQREENRIDNYNVGWLGFIAPIITLLLNRDVITNLMNNTKGGWFIILMIFILLVVISFILFVTFAFARFMFKEKLNPYKYKIAILEIAILQKETEEKMKKKRFYFF